MPKAEVAEPTLSTAAFDARCKTLAIRVGDLLSLTIGEVSFAPMFTHTTAAMTLVGRASETIARNRGSSHQVVRLCSITNDVLAWIGYRELWEKRSAEQNFRFVEGGFTLHVGGVGELTKPQIMRSEWVGPRSQSFANKAGHPHWQLDVLETARTRRPQFPHRFQETPEFAMDFSAEMRAQAPEDVLLGLTVENMHPGNGCVLVAKASGAYRSRARRRS